MAKVKQDAAVTGGAKKEKAADPKKPGRNDLVNETTQNGAATFKFDEPMTVTGDFTSYNGGKGTHAHCVVRNDGQKFKSGRTGLKYLVHADGRTLLDHIAAQSKRGRPKKKKEDDPDASKVVDETVSEPVAAGANPGQPTGANPDQPGEADPFGFMDGKEPK